MSAKLEYQIAAVPFHTDKPTHQELETAVQELINEGYAPLGRPFLGEEMMYQALTRQSQIMEPD